MFPRCRKSCSSTSTGLSARCPRPSLIVLGPGESEKRLRRYQCPLPNTGKPLPLFAPAPSPSAPAPVAPAPTGKLIAVDDLAFPVFEHAVLAIGSTGVHAQSLGSAPGWIHSKGGVFQTERDVPTSQFLESSRDIHISTMSAVAGSQNLILPV